MEVTVHDSVEPLDPPEWSTEKVGILSSDHWELLNVFSLPEIKCCNLEWMTVFSSHYLGFSKLGDLSDALIADA